MCVCGKTDYTATLKVFRVRVLSVAKRSTAVSKRRLFEEKLHEKRISTKLRKPREIEASPR